MDIFELVIFALFMIMIIRTAWLLIMERRKNSDKQTVKFVFRKGVKYIKTKHGRHFRW